MQCAKRGNVSIDKKYVSCVYPGLLLALFMQMYAQDAMEGYTLYPSGKNCYLYLGEEKINTYVSTYSCMAGAYLLRDSSVLFPGKNPAGLTATITGGQFQIIAWDGELIWDFQYACSTYCPKYDCVPVYYTDDPKEIPNVLTICEESVDGVRYDKLTELKRTGKTTGEVVWEWHVLDHTTSNTNESPELFDAGDLLTHINSLGYIQELKQVVIGVSYYNEIMVLDKSTTTEEAVGHTGGDHGKGGDILYRWGKPSNYGCTGNEYLDKFHGANGIPLVFPGTTTPMPGGGNLLLLFNNASDIIELEPPKNPDGTFFRESGKAFGPDEPILVYNGNDFNQHQGSCQRLPNGNTFISNWNGDLFEVTESGDEVFRINAKANKAWRYPLTYFDDATSVKENKGNSNPSLDVHIHNNTLTEMVQISFENVEKKAEVKIYSLNGRELFSRIVDRNNIYWNAGRQSSGVYIGKVVSGDKSVKMLIQVIK